VIQYRQLDLAQICDQVTPDLTVSEIRNNAGLGVKA
jgi:hypothetical protein